jgi:antitoxin ParD1/3/4
MLNISLPDQIKTFVEEQATLAVTAKPHAAGFNSANEYVYHLILREQGRIAQQERIESLLLEGLESGEPVEATDNWWEQKRTQLVERFQQSDV